MKFLAVLINIFVAINAAPILGDSLGFGNLISDTTKSFSNLGKQFGNVNYLFNDFVGGFGDIGSFVQGPLFQRGLAAFDSALSGYDKESIHGFTSLAYPAAKTTFNDYNRINGLIKGGHFDDRTLAEIERGLISIGNQITKVAEHFSTVTGSHPHETHTLVQNLAQSVAWSLQIAINEARNQLQYQLRKNGRFDLDVIFSVFLSNLAASFQKTLRPRGHLY